MKISVEATNVAASSGESGSIANHTLLVFHHDDQIINDYAIRGGPEIEGGDGKLVVDYKRTNENPDTALPTYLSATPDYRGSSTPEERGEVELYSIDANMDTWRDMMWIAEAIHSQEFEYEKLGFNSNTTISTILRFYGINMDSLDIDPDGVTLLGTPGSEYSMGFSFTTPEWNLISSQTGGGPVSGSSQNDWIAGSFENDMIDAGAGHDKLFGNSGHDNIYAGAGNDTLAGGTGVNILDGGEDYDTAVYETEPMMLAISRGRVGETFDPQSPLYVESFMTTGTPWVAGGAYKGQYFDELSNIETIQTGDGSDQIFITGMGA